jgi:hypothetical protein
MLFNKLLYDELKQSMTVCGSMYIKMKSDIYICVYSFVPLVFNLFPFRLQIGRTSISIL